MGLKEKLAAQAGKRVKVEPAHLPADWEGREEIFIRKLSAKQRDNYELSRRKTRIAHKANGRVETETALNLENLRARLLVLALADADGRRIYADADADALGDLIDGDIADVLFEQASAFNGLNAPEEPAGNALATPSASASASPPSSASGT